MPRYRERPPGERWPLRHYRLTWRETQVLQALANGAGVEAVCCASAISERTLRRTLTSIYGKFNATNRVQALVRAAQAGAVELEPDDHYLGRNSA